MLHFDGELRSCVKFKKAKGGVLRCVEFKEGLKYPCKPKGLKGRSQNYIRASEKGCSGAVVAKTRRKARKSARKSRK